MNFFKSYILNFGILFSTTASLIANPRSTPECEVTIVGGGIAGALHAYQAHREAFTSDTKTRVIICEKNKFLTDTTTLNIVPSLTPDEILSVVPRGAALVEKLQSNFREPGGIWKNLHWRSRYKSFLW